MRRIKYTDVFSGDDLQHLIDTAIEGLYKKDSRAQIDHIEVKFVHNQWVVNSQGSRSADFHYKIENVANLAELKAINKEFKLNHDFEIIRVWPGDVKMTVLEKIYDE